MLQTVYAYLHYARRGELRNLTDVAKNCEKDSFLNRGQVDKNRRNVVFRRFNERDEVTEC